MGAGAGGEGGEEKGGETVGGGGRLGGGGGGGESNNNPNVKLIKNSFKSRITQSIKQNVFFIKAHLIKTTSNSVPHLVKISYVSG